MIRIGRYDHLHSHGCCLAGGPSPHEHTRLHRRGRTCWAASGMAERAPRHRGRSPAGPADLRRHDRRAHHEGVHRYGGGAGTAGASDAPRQARCGARHSQRSPAGARSRSALARGEVHRAGPRPPRPLPGAGTRPAGAPRDLFSDTGWATPAARQQPPPTWGGARRPRGVGIGGRAGASLLWIDRALLGPNLDALREGRHEPTTVRMGGVVTVVLTHDRDAVSARIRFAAARHHQKRSRGRTRRTAGVLKHGVPSSQRAVMFCSGDLGGLHAESGDRHDQPVTATVPRPLRASPAPHQ
ncbi:hypothetical protein FHX69_4867 [Prauserella muralis]|nr:hypothetical protein FHX69_4867 [Prauserella muralis]